MKIAVFCPNWVGDLVMATPALRALRQRFSNDEIVAVARPYVTDVLDGLDLVDRLLLHNMRPGARSPGYGSNGTYGWRFGRRLRAERFDLAVLFPNSSRSALWAWISGAKRRVGFAREGRGWLLTDSLSGRNRQEPHPVIDDYLRLVEHLGCCNLSRKTELATSPADERQLHKFWKRQRLGNHAARGIVCLNPGGAFGTAKHWPVASFARLAARIATELDKRVLVLCGPAERNEAREIAHLARHPAVVSLADEEPSIGLTKAAVRRCDLLVTTDSGPRHFAQPFGVPVVTLFGPTHTAWSETYYDRSLHLQLDVDCGPCQQRVCPVKHHKCMRDLNVEWVFKAAVTLLNRFPEKHKAA